MDALDTIRRDPQRRFTTIEGYREAGNGIYLVPGSGITAIALEPNPREFYDPEWGRLDDRSIRTRCSRQEQLRLTAQTLSGASSSRTLRPSSPKNPFLLPEEAEQNPFADPRDLTSLPPPAPVLNEKPFHIFSKRQKWTVVGIIGTAGLFSGLSSNIYFPSLDAISKDLNVSLGTVALTITSYLIVQGVSPLFWGPLSDTLGRRPIYIASFSLYILANVVLSFSPNFPVLLIFRGVQSAGSASTVSIGNGVIQDIATPLERGAYIAFYQAIRNFSIAIGPVLGGVLAQSFGFRSIFVFLAILSSVVLIMLYTYLPETLRSVAGNGTLKLTGIYQPLIRRVTKEPDYMEEPGERPPDREKVTAMTFIEPLKLLAEKDILITLLFGGLVYTTWSMVTASTTGLFKDRFALTETLLGLAFLPNGFGTIAGSSVAAKLMTRDFLAAQNAYLASHPGAKITSKSLPADFPIEHSRLRHIPWITIVLVASVGFYGITLLPAAQLGTMASSPGWIVLPLALQFLIAATSNAVFAINTTLVSDLCPGRGASATAVNNLVRCGMAAIGVALIDGMLALMGSAAAHLVLAMLLLAAGVLMVVQWFWGQQWRGQRMASAQAKKEAKLEGEGAKA